jgi:putative flippase GtrA
MRFSGVGLAGIAVQLVLLAALVDWLNVGLQTATFAAVSAAIVHNFYWHVKWTWADRGRTASIVALFARFGAANGLVSLAGNLVLVTVLVERAGMATVPASAAAIAACAVVNYAVADLVVFAAAGDRGPS